MSDNNATDLASIMARLDAMEKRALAAEERATMAERSASVLPNAARLPEFVPGSHYFGFPCLVKPDKEKSVFMPFEVSERTIVLVCGDSWDDGKRVHLVGPVLADCPAGAVNVLKQVKPSWDVPTLAAGCGVDGSKRKFPANDWLNQTAVGSLFQAIDNGIDANDQTRCVVVDVVADYNRQDELVRVSFGDVTEFRGFNGEFRETVLDTLADWFEQLPAYGDKSSSRRNQGRRKRASHR